MPPELRGYGALILCATPRSGTTLLCDLLADSGVAGNPNSYFRRESIADFCEDFGIAFDKGETFDRAYLEAVRKHATRGGVLGLRVMWPTMRELMPLLSRHYPAQRSDAARIEAAFGHPLYLHIGREDKVAQAVSRLKAEQTGLWHRNADGRERGRVFASRPAAYDPKRIDDFVAESDADNASWEDWFAHHDVAPLRLTYESLSADPQGTLATILTALGSDPAIARTVEPRTKKLADAESHAWSARFVNAE